MCNFCGLVAANLHNEKTLEQETILTPQTDSTKNENLVLAIR